MNKIEQWQQASAELAFAKNKFDEINLEIASEMLGRKVKSEYTSVNGVDYKVTVVQSETAKVDEKTLFDAIGKRAFDKIADLKLNKRKLEAAIQNGRIDPELVARNTVISKSSPYIRVTERSEDED